VTGRRNAADWLSGAVVALADHGIHVPLSVAATERVRAAADPLFHELTEPDAVQEDDRDWEQQWASVSTRTQR